MDNQASNPAFFKSRTVLGKLSASFKFMNENLGTLLKLGTYLLLPVVIVQGVYSAIYGYVPANYVYDAGYVAATAVTVLFLIVCLCLFNSLIYTLIRKYATRGDLPSYRLKDLKEPLLANAKKVFLLGLALFVVFGLYTMLAGLLAWLSLYTLILTIPLFFVLVLPFFFSAYVYILEELPLFAALKKAFVMGMRAWGSTFAVLFVTGLLAGIIQFVAYLPLTVGLMAGKLAANAVMKGEVASLPGFFPLLIFVLTAIALLVSILSRMMIIISMGFQYASVETTRKERLQLEEEVQSL